MRKILFAAGMFVLIGFTLISCTEEQLALNLLAGEWGVTEVLVDDVPQDPATYKDIVYVFDDCLETDPECFGRITDENTGNDLEFTYMVGDDFEDFSLEFVGGINEDWVYDVDEHSFNKVVISATDTAGVKTTTTLEKSS